MIVKQINIANLPGWNPRRAKNDKIQRAVVVGSGEHAWQFTQALLSEAEISFLGRYTTEPETVRSPLDISPVLGNMEQVAEDAAKGKMDIVYLALSGSDEHQLRKLIEQLSDSMMSVYILLPDIYSGLFYAKVRRFKRFVIISVHESPFEDGINAIIKRLEDIVIAVLALCILALPMILIAALIKATSSGPALFKQRRYGVQGKVIEVWKFRTMAVCEDGANIDQAKKQDPRVTPLGSFLRGISLDELPQFINVLQGSMSVVGPRPHAVAHNEHYRKLIADYMLRHKVKPGITGWAQVNGWRGETDVLEKMQKRVEHDFEYIDNWSLFFDLKIILLTRHYWKYLWISAVTH
uniref:Undecaprenyl-phosphate glucose phosphotransferase n=1 Tax=Candidatus Kentrum sp. UNK TaxID=2126344 RepID=A0A451A8H3_9GAMM|nr:MAG: Undecaprenyl-phosphate glucose phosphotransferase [Candidatus Kentron sp. UNK]VFK70416.1 MAG: Undecaprenyl-phosphate glucose phosphotransferase [Candidatus Kentron sp. UNK]